MRADKAIRLYKVWVDQSASIFDTGIWLSPEPWSGDTDRIKGGSAPADVVLELNPDVRLYQYLGQWHAWRPARRGEYSWRGRGIIDSDLVAIANYPDGWGRVRPLKPGEEVIDLKDCNAEIAD